MPITTSRYSPQLDNPVAADPGIGRRTIALIALLAALPTLASAVRAGFIVDDWAFLRSAQQSPMWWLHGPDIFYRPGQAAIHGVMFGLLGAHPLAHLLVLAGLEAAVVIVLAVVLGRLVSSRMTATILLVWALLPNRSAPRLWSAAAPVSVSLLLLCLAACCITARQRRPLVVTALCCAAVLTYEAGALVGAALIGIAWFDTDRAGRDRWFRVVRALSGFSAVVVWNVWHSPKGFEGYPPPSVVPQSLLGSGLMPHGVNGVATTMLLAATLAVCATGLRSQRHRRTSRFGLAFTAAALLPLLLAGAFPPGHGPGDRLNSVVLVGVAVLLGSGYEAIRCQAPRVVLVAAALFAGLTVAAQIDDISAVNAARRDVDDTIVALSHLPQHLEGRSLILDAGDGHDGWFGFGWGSARAAVEFETGTTVDIDDPRHADIDPGPGDHVVSISGDRIVEHQR